MQIDEVLAQENAGDEVLWALADNLGSVKILLDNQGNVVNEITYDAFGNITVESNPEINFRFSYTGRELDPETGNYYYRTRLYDPVTHQFISQDTIGFAGGDSNLYRYVVNSPVNFIDPFGLFKDVGGKYTGSRSSSPRTYSGSSYSGSGGFDPRSPYRRTGVLTHPGELLNAPVNPGLIVHLLPPSYFEDSSAPDLPKDLDPLKINPEENNNDFFNPDEPDSWFDKFKDKIEDLKEWYEDKQREKEKRQDNNQGDSCGIDDRPDYLDPQANSDDKAPEGSKDDDSDSGDGQDRDAGESQQSDSSIDDEFEKLTPSQQSNFRRFKKKIPANSKDNIEINRLPDGGVEIKATSPGKVPGSRAIYEKQVDANGNTVRFTKTTIDPNGNIVHIKDKFGR